MIRLSPMRRLLSGGRWLLLFPLIALFCALWGVKNYFAPPAYSATGLTQVNPDSVAMALGMPQNASGVSPAQQNVNRLKDLLNDDMPGGFIDTVLKHAGTNAPISLDPAAHDPRLAKMLEGLSITPQSESLYAISLVWDKPDECQQIVDAVRTQYIQEVGYELQARSIATETFLSHQIRDYERRMQAEEQFLIDYRSRNLGGLPETQSADISKMSSLRARLDDIRISQHALEMKRQALLMRIASAAGPKYSALQPQLIDASIAQQTQQAQVQLLQKQIAWYTSRVHSSPIAQRELISKTRDYSLLREQYEFLVRRQQQIQLKGSLDAVEASSTLQPIGVVYAHRVRPFAWIDPRLAGSIAAAMLLAWAVLLARRRRLGGRPVLGGTVAGAAAPAR